MSAKSVPSKSSASASNQLASRGRNGDAAAQAFARGDFATLRRLQPGFVAPTKPAQQVPAGLFSPSPLVRAVGAGSALLVALAWAYALTRR